MPLDEEGRETICERPTRSWPSSRLPDTGVRLRESRAQADSDEDASVERDLTYVGILGLVDPPRAEVRDALAECHRAGIKVAMVTGDHALTARAIAIHIGLLDGRPDTPW